LHWCIAIPFLVCLLSAAVLVVVYNPNPQRPYRAIVSWIHRGAGIALIGLPLLAMVVNIRDTKVYLRNLKEGLLWSFDDVIWLMKMPLQMLRPKTELPEEGKFNAGEKLNFMMTTGTWPLFAVTGLLIWHSDSVVVPWLLHISLAAFALPLVMGHIFMATVNPATRVGLSGMWSGLVDRHWASHHYRRWFRENFAAAAAPRRRGSRDSDDTAPRPTRPRTWSVATRGVRSPPRSTADARPPVWSSPRACG